MALTINNNLMAAVASNNLSNTYNKLSTSVQRLSSGLRINSAADDAAGLAIREMMRSDIATTQQGLRNAADAISMIQTADGALSVIDEKLTRMKELAEQASTGTYTTLQREIINSEYQAMAAEIDRIANATNFNGIKLLDGSVANQHGGQGIKIHFGTGNKSSEDYYFVNIGDSRATTATGLQVGGDAKNDIWAQGGAAGLYGAAGGCCSSGFDSRDGESHLASGSTFSYGYNWDWKENDDASLLNGKYTAGVWTASSGESLQSLVNRVNLGTQSRVGIVFNSATGTATNMGFSGAAATSSLTGYAVCIGDESYYWGCASTLNKNIDNAKSANAANTQSTAIGNAGVVAGKALTSAINNNSASQFWAMWDASAGTCYVFAKEGGDNNNIKACEVGASGTSAAGAASALGNVSFENVATGAVDDEGANFSLGGEHWATMKPVLSQEKGGSQVWNVTLSGRDVGKERDLWIANIGSGASFDLDVSDTIAGSKGAMQLIGLNGGVAGSTAINMKGLSRDSFSEIQDAAGGLWKGAEIRTQSSAQEALDALTDAISKKDKIRADLGSTQNRLENTMTNLSIQAENLQAAESRISDVDVATEMTEFTKNNIMAQAATGMLAQANSLAGLALQLL